MPEPAPLTELVTAVTQAPKYRQVSPDLVRRLGEQELHKRRNLKAAVKATKNKLHQVGGAYQAAKIDYEAAEQELAAAVGQKAALRRTCRSLLAHHASTRERLPILDTYYSRILAGLPPIHSLIDIACGLNPLTLPWLPLAPEAVYQAYDIYADMMAFLGRFFELVGQNGQARQRDIIGRPPAEAVDLVLILKTLPCLEQIEKGAAERLLTAVNGRYLLISYPAKSLGGRRKNMVATYEAQFQALAAGRPWTVTRFEFPTELAFLVKTEEKTDE